MPKLSEALKQLRSEVKSKTKKVFSARAMAEYIDVDREKYSKWEQGFYPADSKERDIFKELFRIDEIEDDIKPERISAAAVSIASSIKEQAPKFTEPTVPVKKGNAAGTMRGESELREMLALLKGDNSEALAADILARLRRVENKIEVIEGLLNKG